MSAPPGLDLDPRVPGLVIAVSRDALLAVLSEHLPECRDGVQILDARTVDVQYAPGASAHVLWKLKTLDRETGWTGRQLVFVKACARHDSAPSQPSDLVRRYRALRARPGMAREMPLRTPWLFIPSADLLVHAFPLDPLLPTLMDAADPQAMKKALHCAWQPRGVRVRRVRIDPLSYTPEARAALRYEVLGETRDTGLPELRRLVGKVDARRSTTALFAGHWAVWRQALGRISIAPPVGYVALARLSLQEFVTGTRLSDLAGGAEFAGLVRDTARAIARVHALALPVPGTRGVDKEMRAVDRWMDVLAHLCPAHSARVESIGRRLAREVAGRLRITATIHGDFHLANVLADDHGVTLVDWDQVACGDPMVDVGRVLASLRVSSLRVHGTVDGFADVEEGFLRTYLDMTDGDERRARLFEAVALLVAAAAPFRLQREGWEQGAELMLAEAERMLDLSLVPPGVAAGMQPGGKPEVPFEERSRWALDGPFAQALLVPVVHETYGSNIELTECRGELTEQRRDRLHVRWTVKGYRGAERWRGSFGGVGFPDDSGRGRLRRLEIARDVAAHHAGALQLPRPLGHLAPISMIVFVPPAGDALAQLLDTPHQAEALRRTADALAAFHGLTIDLGKALDTARVLDAARRRVDRLAQTGHLDAPYARILLERIEETVMVAGERRVPTVLGLHPRHLRINGADVAASLFEDVLWADPRATVGDLLAELAVRALERRQIPSAAEQLRHAYAEAAGCSEEALRAFEALGLLSRACKRGVKRPADGGVASTIRYAASLVCCNLPS